MDADGRFFLVADGMGGQSAGEKASEMATQLVPQQLVANIDFESNQSDQAIAAIDKAVAFANSEIMSLGDSEPEFRNMGTTLTFLVISGDTFFIGGVGDSRVYLLRGNHFEQLTTDHSLTQALVDAGTISHDEAANHRYKNVLYRYLGSKEGGTGTQPRQLIPQAGDRFFLCSDGVTDGIDNDHLKSVLKANDDPQIAADAAVAAALEGGSKDNISCVVINVS